MKKITAVLGAVVLAFSISACSSPSEPVVKEDKPAVVETPATVEEITPPAEPVFTAAQDNAIRKAEAYLDFMPFSKEGLATQLEFDKFAPEDAAFAVENIEVDWNEQAAKKGKLYIDTTPMSRDGLIKQLEFDKFTPEEAAAGATSNGL